MPASHLERFFLRYYESNNQTANITPAPEGAIVSAVETIPDEEILSSELLSNFQKYCVLCFKYHRYNHSGLFQMQHDLASKAGLDLAATSCRIDFLSTHKNDLIVTGVLIGAFPQPPDHLFINSSNTSFPCVFNDIEKTEQIDGITYQWHRIFSCQIPLSDCDHIELTLHLLCDENNYTLNNISYGRYSPTGAELNVFEPLSKSLLVNGSSNKIVIIKATSRRIMQSKLDLFFSLLKSPRSGAKKALVLRFCISLIRPFIFNKRVWLINDRIDSAGDNGEAFFRWLSKNKADTIKPIFIISKESKDYRSLQKYGAVIPYGSFSHKLLYLLADSIFSSAGELDFFEPFYDRGVFYRNSISVKKTIYLQHGVTKSDLSSWLGKTQRNFYGFITSSQKETDFIVRLYGYTYDHIWLTGMARYDMMEPLVSSVTPRQITVMPTWRKYLMGEFDHEKATRDVLPGFEDSVYVSTLRALLSDTRLKQAAKQHGYTLAFRPHPNMIAHIDKFHFDRDLFIDLRPVAEVYANSALLVNDYSSGSYDFSYLHRPVIYYQFDRDQFFSGAHTFSKENINYDEDALGELVTTHDEIVALLIKYMETKCILKDEFSSRINTFFEYQDFHNCQRIYEKAFKSISISETK